jgi:hypothetical protein
MNRNEMRTLLFATWAFVVGCGADELAPSSASDAKSAEDQQSAELDSGSHDDTALEDTSPSPDAIQPVSEAAGPMSDAAPSEATPSESDGAPELEDVAPGACHAYKNIAPAIEGMRVPEVLPTPAGGTFVDGVYRETAFVTYTGPGGAAGLDGIRHQLTGVFSGNAYSIVFAQPNGGEGRSTVQLAPSGAHTNGTVLCPSGRTFDFDGYDATPTRVIFYSSTSNTSYTLDRP